MKDIHPKLLAKIRKLVRLSKSSNIHEAQAAGARAVELMLRYQVEEKDLADDAAPVGWVWLVKPRRDAPASGAADWLHIMARGVAQGFGCEAMLSTLDETRPHPRRGIVVAGAPPAVAATRYLYQALVREINRLVDTAWDTWRLHGINPGIRLMMSIPGVKPRELNARAWKRAFRIGAADALSERLLRARAEKLAEVDNAQHGHALLRLDRERGQLEQWMGQQGVRAAKFDIYIPAEAYERGRQAAAQIPIRGGPGLTAGHAMVKE